MIRVIFTVRASPCVRPRNGKPNRAGSCEYLWGRHIGLPQRPISLIFIIFSLNLVTLLQAGEEVNAETLTARPIAS